MGGEKTRVPSSAAHPVKTALSIAGFDPSSGAGVTADLAVFAVHRIFGTAAVTALTVQSTVGVSAVVATDPELLAATLAEIVTDLPPAGIKIGMVANEACVRVVADFLERTLASAPVPVVLDPVLVSTSGTPLLEPSGVAAMMDRLLPLAGWVTPNRQECAVLTGCQTSSIPLDADLERMSTMIRKRWPATGFVVTGGDSERADDLVLAPAQPPLWLRGEKVVSRATHGTGCAFSSALLCGLMEGLDGAGAAAAAKAYVAEAIRRAIPLGHGRGPLNLLWPLMSEK